MTHAPAKACSTLIVLVACSQLAGAESIALHGKMELAYGERPRQMLDLYPAPTAASDGATPVVVYFHGGGFNHGDKENVSAALIRRMHEHGISVASVNYRFATTDPLPASMRDGARAVQYLRHVAAKYRIARSRMATTGSSAGGGIALYIALHDDLAVPDSADRVARQSSRVSCVYVKNAQVSYDPRFWRAIGLSAAMDERAVDRLYGSSEHRGVDVNLETAYAASSPISFLSVDDPPIRLDYSYPALLTSETSRSALIHHPYHGVEIKRQCDAIGIDCRLSFPEARYEDETGYDFLIRHLTGAKLFERE